MREPDYVVRGTVDEIGDTKSEVDTIGYAWESWEGIYIELRELPLDNSMYLLRTKGGN